jgi:hypothetical protein
MTVVSISEEISDCWTQGVVGTKWMSPQKQLRIASWTPPTSSNGVGGLKRYEWKEKK